jgi:type III pantothenate kinase
VRIDREIIGKEFQIMLLAIDIGNTHTVLGTFRKNRLTDHFRVGSNHALTADECAIMIKQLFPGHKKLKDVVICSVVPPLTPVYQEMGRRLLKVDALLVRWDLPLGIKILYDDPSQVGADRIANAVAAYQIYGAPAIIVDLGTATTFDVILSRGEYLGGAIAPGLETSSLNLFHRAAQLFKVSLEKPQKAIGKTTEESLKSGIYFGAVAQIDGIVDRIRDELKRKHRIKKEPKVIATGGLAGLVSKDSKTIQKLHPTLTLEGLRIIHRLAGAKSGRAKKSQKSG